MSTRKMSQEDWKPNPKRKFIGYCPYCHMVLAAMDIIKKGKGDEKTRRVQCRSCNRTFKWSRVREDRPLKDNTKRVRTRWSEPHWSEIVKTFVDFFNLHPLITEAQIEDYRQRLTRSGYDLQQIKRLELQAAKQCNWSKNQFLQERYEMQEREKPKAMMFIRTRRN